MDALHVVGFHHNWEMQHQGSNTFEQQISIMIIGKHTGPSPLGQLQSSHHQAIVVSIYLAAYVTSYRNA